MVVAGASGGGSEGAELRWGGSAASLCKKQPDSAPRSLELYSVKRIKQRASGLRDIRHS